MEKVSVIDTPSRAKVFQQAVLVNLQYWQTWLENKLSDIAAVDRERNGIIRAISFALDFEVLAWSSARKVIEIFSPYMERRGHWEIWNHVLSRAVQVAERVGDSSGVVSLSVLLARLLFQQSYIKESIHYYRRTIQVTRQIGDRFNEARACTNLGFYFIEKGYWDRAKVLCCYALHIFEQINSDHGQAHTENHLGILYTRLHRWDEARQHLERACTIWQQMGDQHGLMRGLTNLGLLYTRMKCPIEAVSYLERALEYAKITGEEVEIARIYLNVGVAHRLNSDLLTAEAYNRRAETIFHRFSNLAGLAQAWDNLGVIYLHQEKLPEAISCLEDSLEAWRKLGNRTGEIETLTDMVECKLAAKEPKDAQARLKEASHLIEQDATHQKYAYLQPRLANYRVALRDFEE